MSLRGGYVRDILKKGMRSYPFCIGFNSWSWKWRTYPYQPPGGAKKFSYKGLRPRYRSLLFSYIFWNTVPFALLLRCSELGWELPIHTVIKKKSFWPSRCWSQMMWEALAFFKLLHKCSSKFSPFLRAKLCYCWYLAVGAGWGTSDRLVLL